MHCKSIDRCWQTTHCSPTQAHASAHIISGLIMIVSGSNDQPHTPSLATLARTIQTFEALPRTQATLSDSCVLRSTGQLNVCCLSSWRILPLSTCVRVRPWMHDQLVYCLDFRLVCDGQLADASADGYHGFANGPGHARAGLNVSVIQTCPNDFTVFCCFWLCAWPRPCTAKKP